MTQINPPYDGSAPCAACNPLPGMAYLHNMFTRWPSAKSMVKLNDLRRFGELDQDLTVPDPIAQELLDVMRELKAVADAGFTEDGLTIRWSDECWKAVAAIAPRAMATLDTFEPLHDAHLHDRRHYSGEENVLRSSRGSRWSGFLPETRTARGDTRYDNFVRVVSAGGHLLHRACGARLEIADYFLIDLRRDPTFFARVYCPACDRTVPLSQFDVLA